MAINVQVYGVDKTSFKINIVIDSFKKLMDIDVMHISEFKFIFNTNNLHYKSIIYNSLRSIRKKYIDRFPSLEISVSCKCKIRNGYSEHNIYMSKDRLDYTEN